MPLYESNQGKYDTPFGIMYVSTYTSLIRKWRKRGLEARPTKRALPIILIEEKKEKFRGNHEKRLSNAEGDKCMYVESTWLE